MVSMTADELLRYQPEGKRTELVRGRLIVREPAKPRHGVVAARMLIEIGVYLREHPIGTVLTAEPGFVLARSPDTVRAPDVAYCRADRFAAVDSDSFAELAPDLVVEVLSPGDRAREVRAKIAQWLTAGTALVWVIDPRKRTATVHRADGTITALTAADSLDGEHVLPGFRARLGELFAD